MALADGIAVKQVGHEPFAVMQRYVDEVVCVEEKEIARAILTLLEIEEDRGPRCGCSSTGGNTRGQGAVGR